MSSVTYRIINADCLDVLDDINNVDLILADVPYGTTQCKWDSVIPFDSMWSSLKNCRRLNTPVCIFGAEPFASRLRTSNIREYKYDWVWEKSKATNFLNAKKQPLRAHETVSVFYRKQPYYNPQMSLGEPYDKGVRKEQSSNDVYSSFDKYHVKSEGMRYPRSVLYYATAESEGKTYHKTQKPLDLLEYLIKTYTNENDTVLDFTMGSGSTGVACINTGRNFIGIEKDSDIYKIARDRLLQCS